MRLLSVLMFCLFSTVAFAFPQNAQLSGNFKFQKNTAATPIVIDLVLRKESSSKAKYKGTATYKVGSKTYKRPIDLEIDFKDSETTGTINLGFDYINLEGPVLTLTTGSAVSLRMAYYQDGGEWCHGNWENEVCHDRPDRLVDTGILNATVQQE